MLRLREVVVAEDEDIDDGDEGAAISLMTEVSRVERGELEF